jgi:hypothetical protein
MMPIKEAHMVADMPNRFVHVLLFACPQCAKPMASTQAVMERNLEKVDENSYRCECRCGWSGVMSGLSARKHWVEPWDEGIEDTAQGGYGSARHGSGHETPC